MEVSSLGYKTRVWDLLKENQINTREDDDLMQSMQSILITFCFIVRFQELFNILYDEKVDCKLVKSNLIDERVLNWNRINGKL
jgi:hypothetical protein